MQMTLEPGWLLRTVHDANMQCMLNHSPEALRHITKAKTPISESEARELYDLMNKRFAQWTGADLAAYAPAFLE